MQQRAIIIPFITYHKRKLMTRFVYFFLLASSQVPACFLQNSVKEIIGLWQGSQKVCVLIQQHVVIFFTVGSWNKLAC